MKELKTRFFTEFLPTLRENAVVVAIQKAVDLMDDSLKQVRHMEPCLRHISPSIDPED